MRITRRNSMLLVYVKVTNLKFPIIIPLPLAMVEELLRAATAVTWLATGGMKGSRRRNLGVARRISASHRLLPAGQITQVVNNLPVEVRNLFPNALNMQPWRVVAALCSVLASVRSLGPFELVDVDTPDARVLIRFV